MNRGGKTWIAGCALWFAVGSAGAQGRDTPPPELRGARVAQAGGKPQLLVDGAPFFVHAALFPYFRLPADLWERSLGEYRALGINTVELAVPWNWHEPRSGETDLDGRSNPRRDLRKLLRLIAEKELKVIVQPVARIPEWEREGMPGWLDADASRVNDARNRFLRVVAGELLPYLPSKALNIPDRDAGKEGVQKTVSGPLLLLALPDASAVETIRAAGIDVPVFSPDALPGTGALPDVGHLPQLDLLPLRPPPGQPPDPRVTAETAIEIALTAAFLSTQEDFPSYLSGASLGARAPEGDVRPVEVSPADGLLLSRLALAQGVSGISYGAIQDALDPAGFTAQGTNPFARMDAALDLNAGRQAPSQTLLRNGMMLDLWAEFLAASEKRADAALVIGGVSEEIRAYARLVFRAGLRSNVSLGAVDPSRQTVERMLRFPVLLWNTRAAGNLPQPAQSALLEYARRGGMLVIFPERPAPGALDSVWAAPETSRGLRGVGSGKIVELENDPFAGIDLIARGDVSPDAALQSAGEALQRWIRLAGCTAVIRRTGPAEVPLVISELLRDGERQVGRRPPGSATGLLSVTNLGSDTAEEEIEVLSPRVSARTRGETTLGIPITVAPQESLLLPLHAPLCADAGKEKCDDEVIFAGAEFLYAERDGKQLELTFYAPARATVRLRFARQPSRARTDEMSVDGVWTPVTRTFDVPIPRGPAPHYLRVLRIQLPYEPHVPKRPDPDKIGRRDYDYAIADGARFPLAPDAALETYPPLVILKPDHTGRMLVRGTNYDRMGRGIDLRVSGLIKGSGELSLDAGELGFRRMDLKPDNGNEARPGLLDGRMDVKSGRDQRHLPLAFVALDEKHPTPYQFDFDRDGAREWVLEDESLRLAASPENGGRVIALVDKESGLSLTNILGMFRDFVTDETADALPPADLGAAAYAAEWVTSDETPALRLTSPQRGALRIRKNFAMAGKQAFSVEYHWEGPGLAAHSVSTALSVPVTWHGENTTRFCWEKPKAPGAPENRLPQSAPEMQCEVFQPHGKSVAVPEGIQHLEVRTPGSFALRFEWPAGQMRVQMMNYSAQLLFAFPRPEPGATEGSGRLKVSAVVVE